MEGDEGIIAVVTFGEGRRHAFRARSFTDLGKKLDTKKDWHDFKIFVFRNVDGLRVELNEYCDEMAALAELMCDDICVTRDNALHISSMTMNTIADNIQCLTDTITAIKSNSIESV
jgi:hypothetical protein